MTKNIEVLFLSESDCSSTGLTMKEVIKLIEEVFKAHGEGNVFVPAKISLDMELFSEFKTWGNAMPAYFPSWKICGMKWIGGNFENPKRHMLPSILGVVVLNDPETFAPLAILSGGWMTAMRTAAATAVAARYLTKKDSKTACIVGAGYQGRHQLLALNEVLSLDEVRVNDVNKDRMEKYVDKMSKKVNLRIRAEPNLAEAVKGTGIIVLVTSAEVPLIKLNMIENGCLICSLGETNLDFQATKSMDKIVVDHLEQSMHMGELAKWVNQGLLSDRDIYCELGDIVSRKKLGRETSEEKILAVLYGVASSDIAIASKIYNVAKEKGLGTRLRLF